MKKTHKLLSMAIISAMVISMLGVSACSSGSGGNGTGGSNSGKLTKVTLNEVAHSIFYAPQYAAIELGYFKDEGLDLTLVNGSGADKVMTWLSVTC